MTLEKRIKEAVKPYIGMPIALSGGVDSSLLAALIKPKFAVSVELPGEDDKYNEIKHSTLVAKHLGLEHHIVQLNQSKFDESMKIAVKAIGRPIPHFNIFPLYEMYESLAKMEIKDLVLGDGPDETMCGYARDLIIAYLYKIYEFEAFANYRDLIDKILPPAGSTVAKLIGKPVAVDFETPALEQMIKADIELMRPDMDDMSNKLAAHFGITNHRPYQDNVELDNFMKDLPVEEKIKDVEFGKAALRKIAAKYLPKEIAWRKKKVGGPVYPVNVLKNWMEKGEFDKSKYMEYQQEILNETVSNNP